MQKLVDINLQIAQSEQSQDIVFFQNLLSENLIFSRANGSVINKAQFLDNLTKPSPFKSRESDVLSINFDEAKQNAVCVVTVKTTNDTGVKSYQNIRFFSCENNQWQLYAWFNQAI
jgi:hypothetical protein